MRLDSEIVRRKMVKSRNIAQILIERGLVLVNKNKAEKANRNISETDIIEIVSHLPFVGRGGEKLSAALKE
jgi:predicted rRNA methylase YqxC with S4 and FtsJ domains